MLLKSIELKNYRPYRGPIKIDFASGNNNITIIQGKNDSGKTSLLNAFTWCLYGDEQYRSPGKEKIWNKSAIKDLNSGDSLIVSVKIVMLDENNNEVQFIRKQKFQKVDNFNCNKSPEQFNILINDGLNDKSIENPTQYLETHLPKELREYFLFDGEQLVQFFNKDSQSVKKSVYNLSQLNIIEKTKNHFQKYTEELIKEQRTIDPHLAKYQKQRQDYIELKDNLNKKIEDNTLTIQELELKNTDLFNKIKGYDQDSEYLMTEKERIEHEIVSTEREYSQKRKDYRQYLIKNFSYVVGNPLLNKVNNISKELEEKGYIPAKFKEEFLDYLLEQELCICGTKLDKNSECYKNILNLKENTSEVTNISEDVNQLLSTIRNIQKRYPKHLKNNVQLYESQIYKLETKIDSLNADLQEINVKLELVPIDLIRDSNKKIENNKILIQKALEENGKFKERMKNIPEKINQLNLLIEQEKQNEVKSEELSKKIDFCVEITTTCDKLHEELRNSIHKQLQELTSEEFKNIHWKDAYKAVLIDDNFNVSFLKEDGSELDATDPSSGSQLVLALSFIIALNSLSGFDLPLIIDTPLSRLDLTIREKLAEYLPEYLNNKQMTLIVTDSEYDGVFKDKIELFVGKKYKLHYINVNGEETKVEPC